MKRRNRPNIVRLRPLSRSLLRMIASPVGPLRCGAVVVSSGHSYSTSDTGRVQLADLLSAGPSLEETLSDAVNMPACAPGGSVQSASCCTGVYKIMTRFGLVLKLRLSWASARTKSNDWRPCYPADAGLQPPARTGYGVAAGRNAHGP